MRIVLTLALVCLTASGCTRSALPARGPAEEPSPSSATRWTAKTELFAEYPPLVVGQVSRFAIHLTRLDTFKPLVEGRVEVQLRGGTRQPETFSVDAPARPGIFGVDVTPSQAGPAELVIVLRSRDLDDEHAVGVIDVHASGEAVSTNDADVGEAPGIGFLKEQQWNLDFATAVVAEQSLRESMRVPARIEARPGGHAIVVAPFDGRLTTVLDVPIGAPVRRGQELARLLPPPSSPGDLPQLRRARADAETSLALAIRDRERADRLTNAGAAPARRLDEARTAEAQARTRLSAAEASLALFDAARGDVSDADGLFIVRAPLDGVVAGRSAAVGATVAAGTMLFQVVDSGQVHVVGRIPETVVPRARGASTAEMELPGRADRLPVGRLVGTGRVLDASTRTLPIAFSVDNRGLALPVGQAVFLHLLLGVGSPAPVVPESAVVDDAGQPIVFIQREGETFERRAVTLGARSGGLVGVTEGLKSGERVVIRGAYLVRLASLSTAVPADGHVH